MRPLIPFSVQIQQIKELLAENADLKLANEEAHSVIKDLQTTNESLKSRLSDAEKISSKADVVSLHNDKILLSLAEAREERKQAIDMTRILEARNDELALGATLLDQNHAQEIEVCHVLVITRLHVTRVPARRVTVFLIACAAHVSGVEIRMRTTEKADHTFEG
jgi:hypothetical protein